MINFSVLHSFSWAGVNLGDGDRGSSRIQSAANDEEADAVIGKVTQRAG